MESTTSRRERAGREDERRPSRRRARRHFQSRQSRVFGITEALLVTVGAVAAGNVPFAALFGSLGLLAVAFAVRPPGVRITSDNQAELWAAVAETAGRLGVPSPRQVWLVHRAEVALVGRRGRQLRVGPPLLNFLGEHEIRALVAHELARATFPRTPVVLALANRWRSVADARIDEEAESANRDTEAELRDLGLAVERVTDDAAVSAAGTRPRAARAIAVAEQVPWIYDYDFVPALGLPRPRWRPMTAMGLEDIDGIWRRVIRDSIEPFIWDEDEAATVAVDIPRSPTNCSA